MIIICFSVGVLKVCCWILDLQLLIYDNLFRFDKQLLTSKPFLFPLPFISSERCLCFRLNLMFGHFYTLRYYHSSSATKIKLLGLSELLNRSSVSLRAIKQ